VRPLSVTARIALLAIALGLVSNLVLVGVVWHRTHDDAIGAVRRDVTERADALAAVWRDGGDADLAAAVADAQAPDDPTLVLALVAPDGRKLAGSGPPRLGAAPGATPFGIGALGPGAWAEREAGYTLRRVGRHWLLSGRVLDLVEQESRALERALALSMLLSLALGVAGGLVVARYVARRLDGIALTVEQVAAGEVSARVAGAGGGDAFDRLALRLNAMLERLEASMAELRVVSDSLAHDLRSPLTRLRTKAEQAVLHADPSQRDAALAGLLAETDLVLRMLATLIEIGRAGAATRERFSPVRPAALVEEVAELYAPVMEEAGLAFHVVRDADPGPLAVHRELLSQALANLLDNALRHAAAGGAVTLRLAAGEGEVRFRIEDRGPGIAEGDRAQALRRFVRLDGARSTPGAGLGMALVDAVARLHGGRVVLADNAPGLVAAIVLPG
jgi:signal transduction histidine kinase